MAAMAVGAGKGNIARRPRATRSIHPRLHSQAWGNRSAVIGAGISKRLPVRFNYNGFHFDDIFEGPPLDACHATIRRVLDHQLINVMLDKAALLFEKSSKNFCYWCRAPMMQNAPGDGGYSKSFCCFFQKEVLTLWGRLPPTCGKSTSTGCIVTSPWHGKRAHTAGRPACLPACPLAWRPACIAGAWSCVAARLCLGTQRTGRVAQR